MYSLKVIFLRSDKDVSFEILQLISSRTNCLEQMVMSNTSLHTAVQKVGSFPLLTISRSVDVRNSNRFLPLLLVSVLTQIMWCTLASQPRIRRSRFPWHSFTSRKTGSEGMEPSSSCGKLADPTMSPLLIPSFPPTSTSLLGSGNRDPILVRLLHL